MFKVLGVIVGFLIAASLAWIGSEMHYRGCIERAVALNPPRFQGSFPNERTFGGPDIGTVSGFATTRRGREAVVGCSRLPF
jgi:hypothetical protein